MTRHDVNTVQALYISSVIQAARKLAARLQANGGVKRTPLDAMQDELQELFDKTTQLTAFERSPQARDGLRYRSDSPELLDALAHATTFLTASPETREALNMDDGEINDTFSIADDAAETYHRPDPHQPVAVSDDEDSFDLGGES
jgi:hypothetical protein